MDGDGLQHVAHGLTELRDGAPDRQQYLASVGEALLTTLGGDMVMWNAVDLEAAEVEVSLHPVSAAEAQLLARQLGEVLDEHPMSPSYLGEPAGQLPAPRRMSDVATPAQLRRNRAWVDVLRPAGWGHQLTVLASPITPAATRGWAVARAADDFPDDALRLARALQPVIALLDRVAVVEPVRPGAEEAVLAAGLTPREHQVLVLVAEGLTSQQIGTRLRIRPRTVEKHREGVYRKLDCHDRMHAVWRAQDLGILPPRRRGPRTAAADAGGRREQHQSLGTG